jgi:hypothetical protein
MRNVHTYRLCLGQSPRSAVTLETDEWARSDHTWGLSSRASDWLAAVESGMRQRPPRRVETLQTRPDPGILGGSDGDAQQVSLKSVAAWRRGWVGWLMCWPSAGLTSDDAIGLAGAQLQCLGIRMP